MKVSVQELMKILSEIPTEVRNAPERRIGKSVSYYDDTDFRNKDLKIDIYFSKSLDKTEWMLEWPNVASEKVPRV